MRINVYAEELTDRVEIIEKTIDGRVYTAVRFYLELPTTVYVCPEDTESVTNVFEPPGPDVEQDHCAGCGCPKADHRQVNVSGPFLHRRGDDDSSAVTFWGKRDLRKLLTKALTLLDEHYDTKEQKA